MTDLLLSWHWQADYLSAQYGTTWMGLALEAIYLDPSHSHEAFMRVLALAGLGGYEMLSGGDGYLSYDVDLFRD